MSEQPPAKQSQIGIGCMALIAVPVMMLAALIALYLYQAADEEPGSRLLRTLFHPGPGYYELSVDLTVAGEPVTITRVMECKPYSLFYNDSRGTFFDNHYSYVAREAMTHRLPSGAGIIVVVHGNCGPQGFVPDMPAGYIPLIAWVDNADKPSEIEAYFAPEALERPDARVRFHAVRARVAADGKLRQSPNEFGLWQNARYFAFNRYPGLSANWFAVFAAVYEEAEWRAVPSLRAGLSEMVSSRLIEGDLRTASISGARAAFEITPLLYGEDGIQLETRRGLNDRAGVVPFRRKGGVLSPSFDERGMIVFYRIEDFFETDKFERGNVPFEISGEIFKDSQFGNNIYFDRQQQRLFNITGTFIRFVDSAEIEE